VPLRLCSQFDQDIVEYKVDRDLMRYVVQIKDEGYKNLQDHICEEMRKTLGPDATLEQREAYLSKHMLVKEDKNHRCYHYFDIFENLKSMPATEFANAIKGKCESMESKSAFDLLFKDPTKFKSIISFRECLMKKMEDIPHIHASPIMLLDPSRVASDRKYKYALELCPKTLRSKA